MNKICNKCAKEKPIELFRKQKGSSTGYAKTCKKCHSDYMVSYYNNNPDKKAEKVRLNSYYKPNWNRHNISEEQYQQLLAKYSGKCHSCRERDASNIDHDHSCCSGVFSCGFCVRGILCNQCNTALGLLKDDSVMVSALLSYINSQAMPYGAIGSAGNC